MKLRGDGIVDMTSGFGFDGDGGDGRALRRVMMRLSRGERKRGMWIRRVKRRMR